MKRVFIGLDDTDVLGGGTSTARLARELGESLTDVVSFEGSVGHRLYGGVKATTNNKASCLLLRYEDDATLELLFERVHAYAFRGAAAFAATGVVMAWTISERLMLFGREATHREVRMGEAFAAIEGCRHQALGSGRGLIGAAAGVGLTMAGWSGRWLEFGNLRTIERVVAASELTARGLRLVSLETDAETPQPKDFVDTHGWLRPQLLAGEAVIPLRRVGKNAWEVAAYKKAKPYH